jgi:predicted metalloprotease
MTIYYPVKSNVFSFLSGAPKAWQLLFESSVVIAKNDIVKLIEVDNDNVPTGATKEGVVIFLNTEVSSVLFENYKLVYVRPS